VNSNSVNPQGIARSATRGALALGLRQLFVQGANIVSGIILARILQPAEFALWGIVTFVLTFLVAFGDAGLAASLVRQQKEPEERDYQAIFTVQQAMVVSVAIVFWLLSFKITELYKLPPQDVWLFRFIALAFVLTSFMVIPQAKLERHLSFDKLAVVEISQALIYNSLAIILALNGVGALSFGIALLLRSLTGAILAYAASPWRLGLVWDWIKVQPHVAFGLHYQGSMIFNLLKDLITPTFIAFYIGTTAVGYINWARMVVNYPLIAVVLLQRLYMPLFARLTGNMEYFKQVLHKIITLICLVVYTLSFLVFAFQNEITITVFGTKWIEAQILFFPLMLVSLILAPAIIAMSALNALGHSKIVFFTTIFITFATWLIGATAVAKFGWQAWGWANLVIHLLYLNMILSLTRFTGLNWLKTLTLPTFIAIFGTVIALILKPFLPWSVALALGLLVSIIASYKLWWNALRVLRI
jgi:O-antigen/teichoic acid export membrane protein